MCPDKQNSEARRLHLACRGNFWGKSYNVARISSTDRLADSVNDICFFGAGVSRIAPVLKKTRGE
jgi:hypothetical protein